MADPTLVLISTWSSGLFVVDDSGNLRQEQANRGISGLTAVGDGDALAIVDGQELCRRSRDGTWTQLAKSAHRLSCCAISRGHVFVGTDDDAQLLRFEDGALRKVESFDRTPGREQWAAGAALIDGKWVGPPLGIRSMSASADGETLLANVHVGGIPRSTDGGATWRPTIDIAADVHEVVCHPSRPRIVAAAAGVGLCVSGDGGATWRIETDGLHAHYCSAAAFVGDDILVAASADHFAGEGAVYRRPVDGAGALRRVTGGMPEWTAGIVDTRGIGVDVGGRHAAIVDRAGSVYLSADAGVTWARVAEGPAGPSGVVVI